MKDHIEVRVRRITSHPPVKWQQAYKATWWFKGGYYDTSSLLVDREGFNGEDCFISKFDTENRTIEKNGFDDDFFTEQEWNEILDAIRRAVMKDYMKGGGHDQEI